MYRNRRASRRINPFALHVFRRSSRRLAHSFVSILVIISMLLSPFSGTNFHPTSTAVAQPAYGTSQLPPPAEQRTATPWVNPQLPSLVIDLDVTPQVLSVGDLFTVTLRINNQAPHPANNLTVTLPLPTGAAGYPDPQPNGWSWQSARLNGGSSTTMRATLRLVQAPPGDAVLVRPQATAQGLSLPVSVTGGALVVQRDLIPAVVPFAPGVGAVLRGLDGRVEVRVPPDAANRPLTLRHSVRPNGQNRVPPGVIGFKRGFPAFYLNASDAQGREFHEFSKPLTVTLSYTPQQLEALGITEEYLSLFWYDESQQGGGAAGRWVPWPTTVDPRNHTITASITHFSSHGLGEDFRPSDAYIPSLKGWQVGLFRGDVSFEHAIEVPKGPGGIKPDLKLTYNSSQTDGPSGMKAKHQSGWAGKGWSLDTGYIAFNKLKYGTATDPGHYSLVLNGQAYDLMRSEPLVGSPSLIDPTDYAWSTTYESFNRIRVLGNGNSTTQRGGFKNGTAYPRQKWQVWTKDGMRFDFEEDAWWGWSDCLASDGVDGIEYSGMETYKWHLSKIVDTHGNIITYTYGRKTQPVSDNCGATLQGVVDYDVWPSEITWAGTPTTGTSPRYKVTFTPIDRPIDTQAEEPSNQIGTNVRETQQLEEIEVWSNKSNPYNTGAWERIRRYDLIFQEGDDWHNYLLSDVSKCDPGNTNCEPDNATRKLTLKEIRQFGSDNTTYLPPTSLTYWLTRGTDLYPQGAWNRLWKVNNNQGGVATFEYQTIGSTFSGQTYAKHYKNNRRITSRTLQDGRGNNYTWTYEYQNPAYNSLGTELTSNDSGPNIYPTSAGVYYNEYQNPNNRDHSRALMVHKRNYEFRGHSYVKETDPNADQTEHWFYQGDVGCYPRDANNKPLTGEAILTEPTCFMPMRDREFLKGREWKTIRHEGAAGTNSKQAETLHEFNVRFYEHGDTQNERLTGLWRAFPYERRSTDTAWERGSTPLSKSLEYTYDISDTNTLDFGNLIARKEYDAGTVLREITQTFKVLSDTNNYIADRVRAEVVKDGQGQPLARTLYAYDGSHGNHQDPLIKGELTLVRKYFTIAPDANGKIYSSDAKYDYDAYGNRTAVTMYAGAGDAAATDTSWSPPGGNSAARTQATQYDSGFHVFPVRITETIPSLIKAYDYDYRMGTLTKETNYNLVDTEARYDTFGRITTLREYGDNWDFPTGFVQYNDWEYQTNQQPTKYVLGRREVANTGAYRPSITFFDGMGREIQTKKESKDDVEHIVEDKLYDGLGQVLQQSQPRYVNDGANFWKYVPPTVPLYRPTSTSYDALGRSRRVDQPDTNIFTTMDYAVIDARRVITTTDPNRHITRHDSDMFGRLRAVKEYRGIGTTLDPYLLDATTSYTYNALDLLEMVTDTRGKVINVLYDALGRKKEMTDLAMGLWSYTYDPNGNLKTQTDPKSQTLTFNYDAMDRLISKTYPGATSPEQTVYIYDQGVLGKGSRTEMERLAAGTGAILAKTEWQYDERGRKKRAEHTIEGMPTTRVFEWGYDSADRNITIKYPQIQELGTSEVVTYGYDAAWRPVSLCSNLYSPCYVNNVTPYTTIYTALDQPERIPLGNGMINRYTYTDPMQRLSEIKVGTGTVPASVFSRSYGYDNASNVTGITHVFGPPPTTETQTFGYDHRDRLTSWVTSGINPPNNESYSYDELGNLQTKAGSTYTYDYNHARGGGGPYAVRTVTPPTGQAVHYTYDNNGNLTDTDQPGRTRHYEWNADNQPTLIERNGANGVTEAYVYDADGERVRLRKGPQNNTWTTFYMEGLWDEQHNEGNHVNTHTLYKFNGQVVAQREQWPNGDAPDNGLRGDYFNNDDLTNFEATKYDANVDFNWGAGSPDPRVENGRFSIQWTGKIETTAAGTYTFATESNGGVKLWVNDTLVIDSWADSGTLSTTSGQITLSAGQEYSIKLLYFDREGNAEIHLKWQPPGTGSLITVPASQLSPPQADLDLPPARNELWYFHTDHLGSVSVATDAVNQIPVRRQEFDPWGKVRDVPSPNLHNTTLNYTGQRLDGSNLLYYHARYYDPQIGRFVSPDSIVPGAESGKGAAASSVGAYQNHKLTVDFHEPAFVESLQDENTRILDEGFWAKQRNIAGPANPQALNRYAYVLNNPVRYTDPSGHIIPVLAIIGAVVLGVGTGVAADVTFDYVFSEDKANFDWGASARASFSDPWTYLGAIPGPGTVVKGMKTVGKVVVKGGAKVFAIPVTSRLRKALIQGATFPKDPLEHGYKHATHFGVTGPKSPANVALFEQALKKHIDDPGTQIIPGTYRNAGPGGAQGHHFYNPYTGLWAFFDTQGKYVAGWKLSPAQTQYLFTNGNVR